MAKRIEDNERIKWAYALYLRDAKGQDQKSIDKALAAIWRFEQSTNGKPFKKFHRLQASGFKDHLARAKNTRNGKPLGVSTVDATLRLVQAFFHWLASQPGYKKAVTYADVEYFNNTMKAARVAHAKRDIPYPSMQQCAHAFQAMPNGTEFEKRDKALFAFFMLTGARDGAVASLKLKHVNVETGQVFQDGRDVNTKFANTFRCQFFPVGPAYRDCFAAWVTYLKSEKLFGPTDALFPKAKIAYVEGQGLVNVGLDRVGYSGSAKLNEIIRTAFAVVQMPAFTPHSFRKTLVKHGDEVCTSLEQLKAWSMNLGHENLATTVNSYLPVSEHRQLEIIGKMAM
ncbi:site-specific integrase [Celeribacter baekdonensis]|uniref:Phage integrase family protein n=2 Tax=Celeribacter baekdonensis TaxID=875171 RepID=K2K5N8_9RHOB|nr:site-specific integrase [Celeribacter baekdonensis]AVW90649.1 site-specific integrase [Celeribacter baekdonensis]EKE72775.1 phage integrase family protein [Celeribacter baekdonensis B30]